MTALKESPNSSTVTDLPEPYDAEDPPLEAYDAMAVETLLAGFLQGQTMPATSPPPGPLGSAPPRRASALTWQREHWREADQPTYKALMAARTAREAQYQPAMAAD